MLQHIHVFGPVLVLLAIGIGIFVYRWASRKDFE